MTLNQDAARWALPSAFLAASLGTAACSKDAHLGGGADAGPQAGGASSSGDDTGGISTGGSLTLEILPDSSAGSSGEPTDPCDLANCNPGQRCELVGDSATCANNQCSDLDCSATERCEPHELGGYVCVDTGCAGDADCNRNEYCDGTQCQPDVCTGGSRSCEGSSVVECSFNGAKLTTPYSCGSSSYFTSECVDNGLGNARCSCEDDWDCPANTFCEAGICEGTGEAPTCTLPPTPFTETLPTIEMLWGEDNSDGTPEKNPVPWGYEGWTFPSTVVANLDDDNGDGLINELDFPEIVFGLTPVLRAIHGGGPRKGADYFARCGDTVWHEGEPLPAEPSCVADYHELAPVVGDLNYDGIPEIVDLAWVESHELAVRILDNTGELLLDTPPLSWAGALNNIALANLDYRGYAEIIAGGDVFMLADDGSGGFEVTHHLTSVEDYVRWAPCVADLTSDPGQEIVIRNGLYRLPDALPTCESPPCTGKLEQIWSVDGVYEPGVGCAVADVWVRGAGTDLGEAPAPGNEPDGMPEVVLLGDTSEGGGVLGVLGADGAILHVERLGGTDVFQGWSSDPPLSIDDMDGDGYMEIAAPGSPVFVVVDLQPSTDSCPASTYSNPNPERTPGGACTANAQCNEGAICNELRGECVCLNNGWRSEDANTESASVFDFNGDGAAEVVLGGYNGVGIYDGLTGRVFAKDPSVDVADGGFVIVDVDNDGNSEIVVTPTLSKPIAVWGDPTDTWVAARRIWNQTGYHVTNVTEAGGIPLHPPESWGDFNGRTYNTYLTQPRSLRVAPDLAVTDIGVSASDQSDTVDITFIVENQGDLRVGPGVKVGFVGSWGIEEEQLLAAPDGAQLELTLTQSLEPGRSTWLSVSYRAANNGRAALPDRVRVIADVDEIERECDEANNVLEEAVVANAECADVALQLGAASASICPSGTVTVTLRNEGRKTISDVPLAFFAGDPAQGGELIHNETFAGSLDPGEERTFDVTIRDFPPDRTITIHGLADPDNTVDECNEANNQDSADDSVRCVVLY